MSTKPEVEDYEDDEDQNKLPDVQDEEGDEGEESDSRDTDNESDADASSDSKEGEADEEIDEERKAIRERRKKERDDKKRKAHEEKESLRRELAARDQIINEMRQRLDVVERKSTGSEAAQIDAAIKQTADAYGYYKQQVAMAAAAGDGPALADAQEKMFQAMRKHEDLNNVKKAYSQRQAAPQPLDPRLKNHAESWMGKNKWYNPAGTDPDSRIALTVDSTMASEGWNPTTAEYWEELDSRLKRYLPHRFETKQPRTQAPRQTKVPVAGSGREQGGSSAAPYKLSAERVAALKEAGMWNDPAAREAAIKRFREYDKQNKQ